MIYLDTNVIIYAITHDEKYGKACAGILHAIENKELAAGASALVLLETAHTLRKLNAAFAVSHGNEPLIDLHASMEALLSLPITWYDMSAPILERAVRAYPRVRTADAVHAVTAEVEGIRHILSPDADFDNIPNLERLDPREWKKQN